MPPSLPASLAPAQVAIPLALVLSLALLWWLDRPRGRWSRSLRSRFLMGVPWGTLVSVLGVLAVYLFVQGGLSRWHDPVTLPFSSWSYLYPQGWLLAAFSHAGPGHLVGNLTGTLAVAPLAEYYFGHFPTRRGESAFGSWRSNPWFRAFVAFPLGVAVIGLLTSVLAWGPIIGFSGVVFAFAAFALVRYPLATVVALSAQGVVQTVYLALRNPVVEAGAGTTFSRPWWYGVAVQGHALGLFLGVVAGVLLLHYREERPSAARVWTGTVLFAMSLSLWALWWYRGRNRFVLFRGWGVVFVLAIAGLVALTVRATDRPLVGNVTRRQAAMTLLVLPLVVMAGVAVPVNFTAVGDGSVTDGGPGVTVRDYTVTYAENVPNQMVSVIDVSIGGETTRVNTSGVIVVNEDREIWTREVSKGRLAFAGRATVRVGGVGWTDTVSAIRRGWNVAGGGTAYQVWLRPSEGDPRHAFASDPTTASPVVAGRNVSVLPREGAFLLHVSRNGTALGTRRVPDAGGDATVGGIEFRRRDGRLVAAANGTRVTVATEESHG